MAGEWRREDRVLGYGRQSIEAGDVAVVHRTLVGDWLTQGPAVGRFERALCATTGAEHAVCVASGTAALHVALLALGVGPGSRVVTSANTFLASATAAVMCGAEVGFVDVEPVGFQLDPEHLEQHLQQQLRSAPVDVVVAVHYAGAPADLDALLDLKERFGFRLVVDGCHALGGTAEVAGTARRVGEVPGVDATTLSFHPVKPITTGEGGAVLTADPELDARLRRLRDHGLDRDTERRPFADSAAVPPWFAAMEELGFNYRLTDVAAALGESQLGRLDDMVAARRRLAARYDDLLEGVRGLRRPAQLAGHAWHLYAVHLPAARRDEVMAELRAGGIGTQVHYYPVPLQPFFGGAEREAGYPVAVEHARTTLSLPLYPGLDPSDQERVAAGLRDLL